MDNFKDSLTQAIKERFTNPLWGYIILSWCGFNWKNFAVLFASKETIEKRLETIESQEWFYTHNLFAPIVVGCVLAAISPYIKWLLSKAHEFGESMLIDVDKKRINDGYQKEIDTTTKRIERDFAARIVEADKQKELASIEEEQKQLPFKTDAIRKEYEQLSSSLELLKKQFEQQRASGEEDLTNQQSELEERRNEYEEVLLKTGKIVDIYRRYNNLSNSKGFSDFIDEIRSLVSDIEMTNAFIKNSVLGDDMTEEEKTAGEIIKNISQVALSFNSPSKIMSEQYQKAMEPIRQFRTESLALNELAHSASSAFSSFNKQQIDMLGQQLAGYKTTNIAISKIATDTAAILKNFDNRQINQMEKIVNGMGLNSPEMQRLRNASKVLPKSLNIENK